MKKKKRRSRAAKKMSLEPGALVLVGEQKEERTVITVTAYHEEQWSEREIELRPDTVLEAPPGKVTWINIAGLHEVEKVEQLGRRFQIHPLVLEDILHTDQRTKFEDYHDYLFLTLKSFHLTAAGEMEGDQVSIIVGPHYVLSFQERADNIFEPVRKRLANSRGRLRNAGADYLAYSLMDAIVDRYFIVIEHIENRIDVLEEQVYQHPSSETVQTLHNLKQELASFRKSVWPLREAINALERSASPLIHKDTLLYLRDLQDHALRIIDSLENLREILNELFDIYMSSVSHRLNEIIKVLTMIATIFMPLSFLTGVYGMNFDHMPGLHHPLSFWLFWLVILTVVLVMVGFFSRKRWL